MIGTLVKFTTGIGSKLVTNLVLYGGKRFLDQTRLGARLKQKLGMLTNKTENDFRKLLLEAYAIYFAQYPDRQYQVFYDFFSSKQVSQYLFDYIFNFQQIDYKRMEGMLRDAMGQDWILFQILGKENLTPRMLVEDFIDCYLVAEKQLSGIDSLLTIREIRQSEERIIGATDTKINDTGDRIISSLVQNFRHQLASLEGELQRIGISKHQVPALESLHKEASKVESVIHEFKIRLQALYATAEIVSGEVADVPHISDVLALYSKQIVHEVRSIDFLFLNLMGYADIAGYHFRRVNLGKLLHNVIELHVARAKNKGIEIVVKPDNITQFPSLDVASPAIDLAIHNVLDNAVKFSFRGSTEVKRRITVVGNPSNHFYQLSVTNLGIEIPKEECEKIFEDGYKATTTKNEYRTGLGHGLYIAKAIIEKHKGRIFVRSEKHREGHINTFDVYLPYQQLMSTEQS